MIVLLWDYIYGLPWFRDTYRRYFLRNIPIISLADYKEKIEIYTKYLEKKSNLVGSKYMRLHRWISQGDSHGVKMEFELRSGTRVLAGGFAAAKFSHSLVQLSSNGHNFFVSAPIYVLFEALGS